MSCSVPPTPSGQRRPNSCRRGGTGLVSRSFVVRKAVTPPASPSRPCRRQSRSEADVVLIDTAGRLHTKTGLMDELGKVKRVVEKQSPVDEVLLVLDATTGQNGMLQAKVFAEVVDVTGVVLTKLDGTAKGGIVIAVQNELKVPVKLVGLGEGADDLAPFDPDVFVDAFLASRALTRHGRSWATDELLVVGAGERYFSVTALDPLTRIRQPPSWTFRW